jgi:hypothetical protein
MSVKKKVKSKPAPKVAIVVDLKKKPKAKKK